MDALSGKTKISLLVVLIALVIGSVFVIQAFALDPDLEGRLTLADVKYADGLYHDATADYLDILEDTPNPTEAETVAYLVRRVPVAMAFNLSNEERTSGI